MAREAGTVPLSVQVPEHVLKPMESNKWRKENQKEEKKDSNKKWKMREEGQCIIIIVVVVVAIINVVVVRFFVVIHFGFFGPRWKAFLPEDLSLMSATRLSSLTILDLTFAPSFPL